MNNGNGRVTVGEDWLEQGGKERLFGVQKNTNEKQVLGDGNKNDVEIGNTIRQVNLPDRDTNRLNGIDFLFDQNIAIGENKNLGLREKTESINQGWNNVSSQLDDKQNQILNTEGQFSPLPTVKSKSETIENLNNTLVMQDKDGLEKEAIFEIKKIEEQKNPGQKVKMYRKLRDKLLVDRYSRRIGDRNGLYNGRVSRK